MIQPMNNRIKEFKKWMNQKYILRNQCNIKKIINILPLFERLVILIMKTIKYLMKKNALQILKNLNL